MKRLILRLTVAILAFGFGLMVDQIFLSPTVKELPQPQVTCDPSRIEVRTVFVPPSAPPPHVVFDFDVESAPPSGYFEIAGKKPKGFQDFGYLEVWWHQGPQVGDVAGEVSVSSIKGGVFENQRILVALVTERRVLVIAEPESGEEYGFRFDGEFVRHNNLRGTLTKTKNGKTIAETFVSLVLDVSDHC